MVGLFVAQPVFSPATLAPVPLARKPASAPATPGYTLITDEELFALLPDEPLLITTNPDGTRRFQLLARAESPR
ncbi:MAG: hypothetical protein H7067_07510 [Burkholderiales bacterium]|nr:hypothetical protein [Opitutaceae bacterium]